MKTTEIKTLLITLLFLPLLNISSIAQYFGRNKPGYEDFTFKVIQTPHFEIYHYLDNDSLIHRLSEWSEEWYLLHQQIFRDTFKKRNPLILYSNHADFQQTTAVNSMISPGTGGVTEYVKNRVVMPVAPTLAQTDHVLGHELVHAFQFKFFRDADTSKNYSMQNLHLWMIEGMAEYLSIGSSDPNTAMWMRDAILNDDFPTLKQLSTDSKYFPYRYGQAFWAMMGKTWGDTIIIPLFELTAQYGLDNALDSIFGFESETLSNMWKNAMKTHYEKYITDSVDNTVGEKIISEDNAGRMNISPSLSPDGKYMAFFSSKDVFTLDLYLADAKSGEIIKKLSSVIQDHEIDNFNFIESGGTWSPDNKKFAFAVFSEGRTKLAIVDVEKAKITKEIKIDGVPSFTNPSWSPDGRYIALSGLVDGIGDIYLYDLEEEKTKKMTDDFSSNIHPAWSPDGTSIVFSTEDFHHAPGTKKYSFHIDILDINTENVKRLNVFPGYDNLNPIFSPDGRMVYFLSNADGFRNLYRYEIETGKIFRLTEFMTGISGVTEFAPAISISRNDNIVIYNYYNQNKYDLYRANTSSFKPVEVTPGLMDKKAGLLPPVEHYAISIVDSSLYNRYKIASPIPKDSIQEVPYRPKFQLDYISGGGGVGVSTGGYNTTGMAGSINMLFSDITGKNSLFAALALNGQIYDFGGQVAYMNQDKRIRWGASVSHIPYRSGRMSMKRDTLEISGEEYPVNNMVLDYIRLFEDRVSLFSYYPLSTTRRFELGASASWYYYRIDRYNNYFNDLGYRLGTSREKVPAPDGNNYQNLNLAYVEDNSFFGVTAPMRGHRSRYQVEKYFGVVDYFTGLIDYRKYFFINPVSFAFRAYHYGRYSGKSITRPLYLGYPWLIRGYENISFYNNSKKNDNNINSGSLNYSNLSGSRIMVGNAEVRLPLTGPEQLSLIKSRYFLIDLNLFFDGGLAWNKGDNINFSWKPESFEQRIPVFSTGASLRVNLFGYLIVEPFYAFPFQNGGFDNGVFGLNLFPGW